MSGNVDCELLISEVQKRPSLWDTSHEDYKDKHKKNSAWVEVCACLIENFATKSTALQKVIVQDVMSKWRTKRDNYIRALRKQAQHYKFGSGGKKTKLYVYGEQLSFLCKNKELRNTEGGFDEPQYEESQDDEKNEVESEAGDAERSEEIASPSPINIARPGKRRRTDVECALLDFMERHKRTKTIEEDEDLAFFYSLLPTVKTLDMDQKLTFRLQTIQLLHTVRNPLVQFHPNVHIEPPHSNPTIPIDPSSSNPSMTFHPFSNPPIYSRASDSDSRPMSTLSSASYESKFSPQEGTSNDCTASLGNRRRRR
ncbi:uncharacterized protein LOC105698239 [Orussus abietinus]|uniref:uncharacterized protein LOC105698239 n=1 Tax=Orussus abietinus TaxID=222816 RepID=UPI000625B78E|nr:uncharacterized protein LOC105698239 [Orussus abietinus]